MKKRWNWQRKPDSVSLFLCVCLNAGYMLLFYFNVCYLGDVVPDTEVVSLPGIAVNVPAGADPGLQGERELWEVNESLLSSIWSVVGKGLAHQVDLIQKSSCLQTLLHLLDCFQWDERVEVAVNADWRKKIDFIKIWTLKKNIPIALLSGNCTQSI